MNAPNPPASAKWVKLLLLFMAFALLSLIAFLIIHLDLFQPADSTKATWVPSTANTRVRFTPEDTQRLYRFDAQPGDVTLLKLDSETPGFAFAAEVRDSAGETIALFSGAMENVEIELAPGTGLYQVAVASADPQRSGTVMLSLNEGEMIAQTTSIAYTPLFAPRCSAVNTSGVDVLVRSAPSDAYTQLGTLTQSMSVPALGRTDDGWVAVNYSERQGWVKNDVTLLQGECAALPMMLNPTIPNAPADAEVYNLEIDRDGEGSFREAISAPQGDTNDLVWISIINLHTTAPNNYREFTLTLNCEGAGLESVRWGLAYSPNMVCGQSVTVPFMHGVSQQPFSIVLPESSRQSYVQYALVVTPGGTVG